MSIQIDDRGPGDALHSLKQKLEWETTTHITPSPSPMMAQFSSMKTKIYLLYSKQCPSVQPHCYLHDTVHSQ